MYIEIASFWFGHAIVSTFNMEEEILFWSRMNTAIVGFCHQSSIEDDLLESLVSAMVGDDLEWCGPVAMSFVARKMVEAQGQCTELTSRCKFLENSLSNELVVVANLRNKLKQIQSQSTDNEWRLQEQLAQLNSMLSKQRIRIEQLERELLEQTQPEHNIHNEDHHGGFMIFEDPQTSHQSMQLSKELHGNKDGKTPHQFPGKENSHAKRKTALGKIDPNNVIRSYASLEL